MAELIGKRYGQALYELGVESGDIASREKEIHLMLDAFTQEKEFLELLNHPKLSKNDKIKMLKEIFEGKVSDDYIGFLVLAMEKSRQEYIVDILEFTLAKFEEHNGYVTAHVTSAIELTTEDEELIVKKLEAQTGKKITLDKKVDKSIIGGLIIRINDRIIDNSIKRNMHRLANDVL